MNRAEFVKYYSFHLEISRKYMNTNSSHNNIGKKEYSYASMKTAYFILVPISFISKYSIQ